MTRLEVAEERERYASWQQRWDEREAAALVVVEARIERQEE
jgi:hypothetical protein